MKTEMHSKGLNTLHQMIKTSAKKAEMAQTDIKGLPGKDVKVESAPDSTETVNKNEVGADKNPQDYDQKKSESPVAPLASAKTAELAAQAVASYQTGRKFAAAIFKQAQFNHLSQTDLLKEAGARDCDSLIAYAMETLNTPAEKQAAYNQEQELLKEASLSGEAFFDELYKSASIEEAQKKNQELEAKVAALETKVTESSQTTSAVKQAIDSKTAAEQKEAEELAHFQKMAATLVPVLKAALLPELTSNVINALKNESAK